MVIVKTKILPPGADAFTAYPFIFIHPRHENTKGWFPLLFHECVHYEQQKRWAKRGFGIGLIVWFLLYLLALPVYWNPFRDRWEREAYRKGQGYNDEMIDELLTRRPYYLWSLKRKKSSWAI